MLPGGEVMLICAGLGKSLNLLNNNLYAVIIIAMLLTTLLAPPLLKLAIDRQERGTHGEADRQQTDG
jgi:predicted Kef-type K+ transport protein